VAGPISKTLLSLLLCAPLASACGASGWDDVSPGTFDVRGGDGGPGVPGTGGSSGGVPGTGGVPLPGVGGSGGEPPAAGGGGISGAGSTPGGDGGTAGTQPDPPDAMEPIDVAGDTTPAMDTAGNDGAPALDLNAGLVGRWKLDEGTGTAANDSSPSANHGVVNGATWVMTVYPGGKYPNAAALSFDGKDAVVLGVRNLPANNRPQTVTFWLNYPSVASGNAQVCVALTDGNSGGSRLKVGWKEQKLAAFKASGTIVSAAPPAAGWHHIAYTYDGTTHRLFVDGTQRDTSTTAADKGAVSTARLGANYDQSEPYKGLLDEVRIYDRPLSVAEIAALNAGQE
jgi:hypothetical protein